MQIEILIYSEQWINLCSQQTSVVNTFPLNSPHADWNMQWSKYITQHPQTTHTVCYMFALWPRYFINSSKTIFKQTLFLFPSSVEPRLELKIVHLRKCTCTEHNECKSSGFHFCICCIWHLQFVVFTMRLTDHLSLVTGHTLLIQEHIPHLDHPPCTQRPW